MRPNRPGLLVDPAESRSRARVTREGSLIPWALGQWCESPGTVGLYCGPTGTGPILPGQLVDTEGPRTRTRVARDRCSTPGASAPGPSCPGKLVATPGPCSLSRVSWERWSTPQTLGPGTRTPVTAGRPRGTWHKSRSASHPGQVVDPAEPRARSQIVWDSCSNPDLGQDCESPRKAGRPHRPSDTGLNGQGHLTNPAGLGQWPDMPGKAGRPCGTSDTGLSHAGQLIDTADPRTQGQIARDI